LIKNILFVILALNIINCGYKPVSHYARENIKTAYVHVEIDEKYPENYIVSKNKIISLLSDKLKVSIKNKKSEAKTYIAMKIIDVSFTPIEYKKGFISQYRASIVVKFSYQRSIDKKIQTKIIKSKYDFSAKEATLYQKLQRDEKSLSVDKASMLAIEEFISVIIL